MKDAGSSSIQLLPKTVTGPLRAPFPWFGGKSRAARLVWDGFGDVPNYVEPFAGSLAVLLGRPTPPRIETVNDIDGFIANFWRALRDDPDKVAYHADWPVNEVDLHARHRWLVDQAADLDERLMTDPSFFDPKVAGWWVWGISAWIGAGWCRPGASRRQMPHTSTPAVGVNTLSRKKPRTIRSTGIHVTAQVPSGEDHAPEGGSISLDQITRELRKLAARIRNVRVLCGEWDRLLGRSTLGIDTKHGMTPCAVFLDPPYADKVRTNKRLYRYDSGTISDRVRTWAIENGDNPQLRIILCGYTGEHSMPAGWRCQRWRSQGGSDKSAQERLWFSPHCLGSRQLSLL